MLLFWLTAVDLLEKHANEIIALEVWDNGRLTGCINSTWRGKNTHDWFE